MTPKDDRPGLFTRPRRPFFKPSSEGSSPWGWILLGIAAVVVFAVVWWLDR